MEGIVSQSGVDTIVVLVVLQRFADIDVLTNRAVAIVEVILNHAAGGLADHVVADDDDRQIYSIVKEQVLNPLMNRFTSRDPYHETVHVLVGTHGYSVTTRY